MIEVWLASSKLLISYLLCELMLLNCWINTFILFEENFEKLDISPRPVVFITTVTAIYSLGHRLCTLTAVPRSTQPSTFRGTVKWVSAYELSNNKMAMVSADDSSWSADSQPKSVGLVWGLAATRRSVCIHQMNQVNSRNDYVMMTAP